MYQSIYRKYRPQTFMEIYGQEAISKTLTNAIILDKVAHAYLFSGPRGTGKTSTAKLLAKAINCTNLVDGKICDECDNCKAIRMNNHPDVIEIDAASNNGVDEVRDLIENVKYTPIQGKKKVYIIDEVHMMSQGAFNALLKTLEEPPEHVVFVLATTELYKVIPTIRSRCQKFTFRKISNYDIVRRLKDIAQYENLTYEEEAFELIASLSEGGMRDALSILEQVMIYSNNDITYLKTSEALDLVDLETIKSIYNLVLENNLDEVLKYLNELKNKTLDFKQAISDIMQLALIDVVKDNSDKDLLINLIENLDESLNRLKYDNNNHLYLQLALIKTLNFKKVEIVQPKASIKDEIQKANQLLEDALYNKEEKKEEKIEVIENTNDDLENDIMDQYEHNEEESIVEDITLNEIDDLNRQISAVIDGDFNSNNSQKPIEDLNDDVEVENKVIEEREPFVVSNDLLLNVIVQAKREYLLDDKERWKKLDNYLMNVNTKKWAGLLVDTIPVVSSEEALVVACLSSENVDLINNERNIHHIKGFLSEAISKDKYCFAITKDDWIKLRNYYMQLRTDNNLPEAYRIDIPKVIEIDHSKDKTMDDSGLFVFSKKIFKEQLEIKTEENENEY